MALTFDDGPHPGWTPRLLDLLAQHRVKATFCVVGENVTWYPELVRRIVAEGHRLCNHSMHHDDLGIVPEAKSRADILAADAAIAAAAPGATVPYFRAPYGDFGPSAKAGGKLGHTPLGWVVDKLEGAGFEVKQIDTVGVHYSSTLWKWYRNWIGNKEKVTAKYGKRWFRIWEFFLAYSTIASRQGTATCFQITLVKNINSTHRVEGINTQFALSAALEASKAKGIKGL